MVFLVWGAVKVISHMEIESLQYCYCSQVIVFSNFFDLEDSDCTWPHITF